MPRIVMPLLILAFSVAGCSPPSENGRDSSGATVPAGPGESSKPRFGEYVVRKADLNKSVSPYDLYFYADDAMHGSPGNEKYFRVVIRRGGPIVLMERGGIRDEPVAPSDQLHPYWYKWTILDEEGKIVRSWLAHFLENRDGNYHTVMRLPPDEWDRSVLEVYFDDVDADGEPEHVTFKLMVGDILRRGE